MSQRKTLRVGDQPWVKWPLIGLALLTTLVFLVVPLVLIFQTALSAGLGTYWENIT